MNTEVIRSNREDRESQIKKGVILTVSPFLSIFIVGPLSQLFPRPNPWPIKGLIGMVLIAGLIVGPLGLQQINRGRSGTFDGLGLVALGLQLAGVFLYVVFMICAMILYGLVFYGLLPFGGR